MEKLIDTIRECLTEFIDYSDAETKELLKLSDGTRRRLEASMTEQQQEIFDEHYKYLSDYYERIENQAFSNGFSLGMRISAEAFTKSEKLL